MSLALTIWDAYGGVKLADWSAWVDDLSARTNEHGDLDLTAHIAMRHEEAAAWARIEGMPYVRLSDDGAQVWSGRLEDITEDDTGISIRAFGYWRAFSDFPVVELISDTTFDRWRLLNQEGAIFTKDTAAQYALTKNAADGMTLTARINQVFNTVNPARVGYEPPEGNTRPVNAVGFNYAIAGPTNWVATLYRSNTSWSSLAVIWTANAPNSATPTTGTFAMTGITASTRLLLTFTYNVAGNTTPLSDAIPAYVTLNGMELKGLNQTINANAIAARFLADVTGLNAKQMIFSTALLDASGITLSNEVYEDEMPADVLTRVAALGDTRTPPQPLEVGVEGQRLFLRERGRYARTWVVNAATLAYRTTRDTLVNSAYAVYRSASGRTLRTAIGSDTTSVTKYAITRRVAMNVQTENATTAASFRDARIADTASPPVQVDMTFDAIYDEYGARHPLWMVRPGDYIRERGGTGAVRRVAGTELRPLDGTLSVTWEEPLPSLEIMDRRADEARGR